MKQFTITVRPRLGFVPAENGIAVGPQGLSAYQVWLANGNTGTVDDYLLAIKGEPGPAGIGIGVPTGGASGQVLAKKSEANYDTEWITPEEGSAGGLTPEQEADLAAAAEHIDGADEEKHSANQIALSTPLIGATNQDEYNVENEADKAELLAQMRPLEIPLPGTNKIPFDRLITKIAPTTITNDITLTPESLGAFSGACTTADFIGSGVGSITFGPDFTPANSVEDDAFANTDGYVSTYLFCKVGEYAYIYGLQNYMQMPSDPMVLDVPSVTMSALSSSALRATWPNVANNSGYQIRISTDNGVTFGTPISLGANVTLYDITSLGLGVRRDVQVRAIGDGVNYLTSDWSTTAFAVTSNLTQLSAPTLNSLTVISSTQINVSWSQVTNNVGYDIYLSVNGSAYNYYANTTTNTNSLNITGLAANTLYGVKVVAKGDGVNFLDSDQSAAQTATTKNVAPTLISAYTNANGTIIYAAFSREMAANPTSVGVSTTPSKTISSVTLKTGDSTIVEIAVTPAFGFGESILATLPQWIPADGGDNYAGVINTVVTNNITAVSLISNGTTDYINVGYTWPAFSETDTVEVIIRGSNLIPTANAAARAICGSQKSTTSFGRIYFNDTSLYIGVPGVARPSTANEIKIDYRLTITDRISGFVDGIKFADAAFTGATLAGITGIPTPFLYGQNYVNGTLNYPSNVSISEYLIKINGVEVVHLVAQSAGYFYDTIRLTNHYNRNAASNLYPLAVG